jgi:hypothetical protein
MARPRFSIRGLMGFVLAASLALAALHDASDGLSRTVSLLTSGVMILAAIAAVFGPREERAWWLGFLLFGMGPTEPLDGWLDTLLTATGVVLPDESALSWHGFGPARAVGRAWLVGHCLLRLLVATLGGALGRCFFGPAALAAERLLGDGAVSPPRSRAWKAAIGGTGLLVLAAAVLVWAQTVPAYWTGWVLLATWGLIGLAAVGAFCDRGKRRSRWTGAALFGGGYLVSVFGLGSYEGQAGIPPRIDDATRVRLPVLAFVEPGFPITTTAEAAANARIRTTLEQRVPIHVPGPATLEQFLAHIASATRLPDGSRLPIDVNPVGPSEAETTMRSLAHLDTDGARLAASLRRLLEPFDLGYVIAGGVLEITSKASAEETDCADPRLFAIHGAVALFAAGLGALLAPLAAGWRGKPGVWGLTRRRGRLAAGLLAIMLLVSVGLAGVRSASPTWGQVMDLGTCGILSLSVVGVFCGTNETRAWWFGFALFGKGYLVLAFDSGLCLSASQLYAQVSPADLHSILLVLAGTLLPRSAAEAYPPFSGIAFSAWTIMHCLASLLAATLGGALTALFFGASTRHAETGRSDSLIARRGDCSLIPLILAIGLLGVVAAAVVRSRSLPSFWTGAALLATWGLFGMAALGAAVGHGKRRVRAIGAALFGAGCMLLVFSSQPYHPSWTRLCIDNSLRALFPRVALVEWAIPPDSEETAAANARIRQALEKTVPMHFARETPLGDVLAFIGASAPLADGRRLPIFVDPIGLQDAEKTLRSPVQLELDGVPLETTLRLLLRQLDMEYEIREGLLQVVSTGCDDCPVVEDARLVAGQFVLAVLASALGAMLAPLVADHETVGGRD